MTHEGDGAGLEQMSRVERVVVELEEGARTVDHVSRKVANTETAVLVDRGGARELGDSEKRRRAVLLVDSEAEGAVARVGAAACVIEDVEDAVRRGFQNGQAGRVIDPGGVRAEQGLEHGLWHALEDMRQEEGVQLLVGVVDAELLKAVAAERLEAEDIEQADRALLRVPLQRRGAAVELGPQQHVEAVHVEREQTLVEGLCERIAGQARAVRGERDRHVVPPSRDDPL
eukprot:3150461-Prymnesium_polylepis.1